MVARCETRPASSDVVAGHPVAWRCSVHDPVRDATLINTYTVIAVDEAGNESAPATIVVDNR